MLVDSSDEQGLKCATHFILVKNQEVIVKAMRSRVAGVDVHKEILAITVLIGDADVEPTVHQFECSTFTDDLMKCGLKLREFGVKEVVMESTGVYWKPLYNVWYIVVLPHIFKAGFSGKTRSTNTGGVEWI